MLTPDNYPFDVYPGFSDPEDWRLSSAEELTEREERKIEQILADLVDEHPIKHKHREHPWCRICDYRRMNFEDLAQGRLPWRNPAQNNEHYGRSTYFRLTDKQFQLVRSFFSNGYDAEDLYDDHRLQDVYDVDVETAWEWVEHQARWRDRMDTAEQDTASRCRRYLTLHSAPPIDTYDPEHDVESTLADEILDRDELADLTSGDPLIDGILTRHAYALLTGRDTTYKSFAAIDWACCLATGKPWQGRAVERVKVLYIVGEGAYDLDNRITAWETGWKTTVEPTWLRTLPRAVDLFGGREIDELLDVVADYGLVIIDTLRRVSGRAQDNGSDMAVVIDNIEKIKRATDNGSVLVVAHTQKDDNDARGFSAIEDDCDIVWHSKRTENVITLTNKKMKSGPDGEKITLAPTLTAGSVILHTTAEILSGQVETTAAQKTILDALATTFAHTDGASSTELIEATGLPKSTFYHARGALLEADLIKSNGRSGRGRYALTRSNSVQRSDDASPAQSPISPTVSNGSGPVQSSPTPLKGLDVGNGTPDNDVREAS